MNAGEVLQRLELLVGAKKPSDRSEHESAYFDHLCVGLVSLDDTKPELLDQLLVAAGFNRPSSGFHEYFRSLGTFESRFVFDEALLRWRVACMKHYGNFRFPYRQLSSASFPELKAALRNPRRELGRRSDGLLSGIRRIARKDTPLLGYLAGKTVKELAKRQKAGEEVSPFEQKLLARFAAADATGLHNTYEYCTMPFVDVYVATSMREHEDFFAVGRFTEDVFGADRMTGVAFFDPTQSSHPDRIVKGIVEGLMLKRSAVTVYLAQEGDTFGKDSELAATLAQGKVVIAFVPEVTDFEAAAATIVEDAEMAIESALEGPAGDEVLKRLLDRAKSVDVDLWLEFEKLRVLGKPRGIHNIALGIAKRLHLKYEQRADTLRNQHPLGLQVNVVTGVANGIIVTRTAEECRELILESLEGRLEFNIEARSPEDSSIRRADLDAPPDWDRILVERRTNSVHRVVIGDAIILNAFWNWYAASRGETDSVTGNGYIAETRGGNG